MNDCFAVLKKLSILPLLNQNTIIYETDQTFIYKVYDSGL